MINLESYLIPAVEGLDDVKERRKEDKKILNQIINDYKKAIKSEKIDCIGVNKYYTFISHNTKTQRDYACIGHPEYTENALKVYVNEWKMDVYNGEIIKASANIIQDFKKKYPMVKISKTRLEKNDETRYYIEMK